MKKRFITSLCALLLVGGVAAQQIQETIYLRNGSIIKGQVVEQIPDSAIKVKAADGSLFVYNMADVERIVKEESVVPSRKDGRHRGLDFNLALGYHISTKGGSGMASAEIGIGKRFNKHFYWGIGTGVFLPTGDGDPVIPITSDFKVYFPLKGTSVKPGAMLRAGYAINTADDVTVGTGKYKVTTEMPNYVMIQIMPTVEIPLSKRVEFNGGLGYTHFVPAGGGEGSGAFSIRAGFTFHRPPVRKPKKPVRRSGVQFTLEGGATGFSFGDYKDYNGGNFAFVATYKYNPHLSFGLGFGGDIAKMGKENAIRSLLVRNDGRVFGGGSQDLCVDVTAYKVFLRGQYRLTDRRFSPFVSCDAGLRFYSYGESDYYGDYAENYESSLEYVLGKAKTTACYLAPAIGVSLRTTNNSYLELKMGYALTPGISGKKGEKEYESNNLSFMHSASCKPMKMSAPFVSLSLTHTFKWGMR